MTSAAGQIEQVPARDLVDEAASLRVHGITVIGALHVQFGFRLRPALFGGGIGIQAGRADRARISAEATAKQALLGQTSSWRNDERKQLPPKANQPVLPGQLGCQFDQANSVHAWG